MTVGVFSTTRAANLQQHISLLNDALSIRLWFSCGINIFQDTVILTTPNESTALCPLIASLSASESIRLPSRLLSLALMLFVVGFGLFSLFSWLDGTASTNTKKDNQNIFIFLTCLIVGLFAVFIVLWWHRTRDAWSVSYPSRIEKFNAEEGVLQELNERLALCQEQRRSRRSGESQETNPARLRKVKSYEDNNLQPTQHQT